jgi:hypothetical protein
MKWNVTGNTNRMMTQLNIRNRTLQEQKWLGELAEETGLVFFSGHGQEGPVSGYRMEDFSEKVIEAYHLRKDVKRMKAALDDCQAELLQEKEYVRILTELVQQLGTNGMGTNGMIANQMNRDEIDANEVFSDGIDPDEIDANGI